MKTSLRLIADSGSTKTDWALLSTGGPATIVKTQGINPFYQDEAAICAVLTEEFLPQLPPHVLADLQSPTSLSIHFYGSGVRPELEAKMERLLREVFPHASFVEAHSDMLGAARALCGGSEGIACILGTGANSCLYDGEQIVENTPALGYILGDEGSGAVLGVRFLNALYKGRLPVTILRDFDAQLGLTMADVISRVYRQPMPNRWLASLSPFIHQYINIGVVRQLVVDNFRDFIRRNIVPYGRPDLPLSAVGSIAYYYREQLAEATQAEGYTLGRILRSPLDAMCD